MNHDPKKDLLSIVNASGFPFQIAVETEIRRTISQHGWKIASSEHAWKHPVNGETGFIDIVLSHSSDIFRAVIECKRPRKGTWVFLVSHEAQLTSRLRGRWINCESVNNSHSGWSDFDFAPHSLESSVCVVRGQGEGAPTMIERLARQLIESTQALSRQEKAIAERRQYSETRIYIPMIVTAASLIVCRTDPKNISLAEGDLSDAEFEKAEMIRFRKSLTTDLSDEFSPRDLQEENLDKERTILVVNALSLGETLSKIERLRPRYYDEPWYRPPRPSS